MSQGQCMYEDLAGAELEYDVKAVLSTSDVLLSQLLRATQIPFACGKRQWICHRCSHLPAPFPRNGDMLPSAELWLVLVTKLAISMPCQPTTRSGLSRVAAPARHLDTLGKDRSKEERIGSGGQGNRGGCVTYWP